MVLTPNDVGVLVEHTVWQRGKVIEILSPYAIIHFPALADSPQGPQRKLREDAPQLTKSSVQSDPALDAIETGPGKPKKVSKKQSTRADAVRIAKAKISRRGSLNKQRQALKG